MVKVANLPIRKDSAQQCRAGTGTGKGPEAHGESGDEKRRQWRQKNRKEGSTPDEVLVGSWGDWKAHGIQVRPPHGQMVWFWGEGRNRGKDRTPCTAII